MARPTESLEEAISSAERLRKALGKASTRQVGSSEERSLVKATALAWFNKHRAALNPLQGDALLNAIDTSFQSLLEFSDRSTTRSRYRSHLLGLKRDLVKLRSQAVLLVDAGPLSAATAPPDFAKLVASPAMNSILKRRWNETLACLDAGAHLAATVMMGALLEALLLARANTMDDMSALFTAKAAPRDSKTSKALPLKSWTLKNYIDVAHEMKWIARSAKDVGEVLRDYRNYIHPEKELKHGVAIDERDARMFWAVFQSLAQQVLQSV